MSAPGVTALLAELAEIGRAPSGGYRRFSWTAPDAELRAWFTESAARCGLAAETDRNGNLWATWRVGRPGLLVLGSHLDSVPDGGAFDGPLGVAGAFAALAALRAEGAEPASDTAVVAFTEEEGGRFGLACLGSRLMTGAVDPDRARALADRDGVTLAEAMRAAGADPDLLGPDPERVAAIDALVELHIEQGRLPTEDGSAVRHGLADAGAALGVASGIWPHGRWRLELPGSANHAGTTPMADRDDPVVAAADAVLAVRDAAVAEDALATVGRIVVDPGAVNAIAERVTLWIDARGADEARVRRVVERVAARVGVIPVEESWTAATVFSPPLTATVRAVARDVTGSSAPVLPSGAGHDAGVLALAGVPSAMLLVRNPTGVSHSPAEQVDQADAETGVAALVRLLRRQVRTVDGG